MSIYAITMLAAGIGVPVLAAMNAALGRLSWGSYASWGCIAHSWISYSTVGNFGHWTQCSCEIGLSATAFTFTWTVAGVLCAFNHRYCTKIWRWKCHFLCAYWSADLCRHN